MLVVIGTDCIGICKSSYHTIIIKPKAHLIQGYPYYCICRRGRDHMVVGFTTTYVIRI
jgi:hypothetical protein